MLVINTNIEIQDIPNIFDESYKIVDLYLAKRVEGYDYDRVFFDFMQISDEKY